MRFNFQSFIINILAVLLLVILLGLSFLVVDRLVLDGQFTGAYNKTQRIRDLVAQINEERLRALDLQKENATLKNQVAQEQEEKEELQESFQKTLQSIPSYRVAQVLQENIPSNIASLKNGKLTCMQSIFFANNAFVLPKQGQVYLDQLSNYLIKLEKVAPQLPWTLQIGGHSNPQTTPTASGYTSTWKLAYKRAFGVVQYLISKGVLPKRLYIASFSRYQSDPTINDDNRVALRFDHR